MIFGTRPKFYDQIFKYQPENKNINKSNIVNNDTLTRQQPSKEEKSILPTSTSKTNKNETTTQNINYKCYKQRNERSDEINSIFKYIQPTQDVKQIIRLPIEKRKLLLHSKLRDEQKEYEKEMSEKEKNNENDDEGEINFLKHKLKQICIAKQQKEGHIRKQLMDYEQYKMKRLDLLNTTDETDLSQIINRRSSELKQDCSKSNVQIYQEKNKIRELQEKQAEEMKQVVMFPDHKEELLKREKDQIEDFKVANRNLMELKRKQREDEYKLEMEEYRRKIKEIEEENRREEAMREEEKLLIIKRQQEELRYLNYKSKEKEDKEKREKQLELQRLKEENERKICEKEKIRREKAQKLEELRQSLLVRQKYLDDMRKREDIITETINKENELKYKEKLNIIIKQDEFKKEKENETRKLLLQQIEERKLERELEKMRKMEMKKEEDIIREKIKSEEEKELNEIKTKKKQYLIDLKRQMEFKSGRVI